MNEYVHQAVNAIPFLPPKPGRSLGLLQAVEITGRRKSEDATDSGYDFVEPIDVGFDEDYFTHRGKDPGDFRRVMSCTKSDPLGNLNYRCATSSTKDLKVAIRLASLGGAGADVSIDNLSSFKIELVGATKTHLLRVPHLLDFFLSNIAGFCSSDIKIKQKFQRQPTLLSGKIEMLLGFVVSSVHVESCELKEVASTVVSGGVGGSIGDAVALKASDSQQASRGRKAIGTGTVGAAFQVFHLVKSRGNPEVTIKNASIVSDLADPDFKILLGSSTVQTFKKMVAATDPNALCFVLETPGAIFDLRDSSTLENLHSAVQTHVAGIGFVGAGTWDPDGSGKVVLDVSSATPLYGDSRVEANDRLESSYRGSWKWVYTAQSSQLSKMYEDLKAGKPVVLFGATVHSMKPAVSIDSGRFLPIYYAGKDSDDPTQIPGHVLRYEEGATIRFPVFGYEENLGVVTMRDPKWHVRESIVYIKRDDTVLQSRLLAKGFHILDPAEADTAETEALVPGSFVVMGRHQLARYDEQYDEFEEQEPAVVDDIFRLSVQDGTSTSGGDDEDTTTGERTLSAPSAVLTEVSASSPRRPSQSKQSN